MACLSRFVDYKSQVYFRECQKTISGAVGKGEANANQTARNSGQQQIDGNGAVDRSNLETAPVFSILEELENWAGQLKALPEVTGRLREFEVAARGPEEGGKPAKPAAIHRNGPHRSGPSR